MTPDLSKLEYELDRLREYGQKLQKSGQTILKIAESGRANLTHYYTAYKATLDTLGDSPQVQDSLNTFMESGNVAVSALHSANQSLAAAKEEIYVSIIPALSGVTISNVATQNLVAFGIEAAPEEKKGVFVALSEKVLHRSFSNEELDALLENFRKDFPGRRRGAWDAFYSVSEDNLVQAAHSMREILSPIIAELGSNERLKACKWFDASKEPKLSDRVRLLLYGTEDNIPHQDIHFVASQISEYVSQRANLINVAHGSERLNRESVRLGMQKIEELLYLILSRSK